MNVEVQVWENIDCNLQQEKGHLIKFLTDQKPLRAAKFPKKYTSFMLLWPLIYKMHLLNSYSIWIIKHIFLFKTNFLFFYFLKVPSKIKHFLSQIRCHSILFELKNVKSQTFCHYVLMQKQHWWGMLFFIFTCNCNYILSLRLLTASRNCCAAEDLNVFLKFILKKRKKKTPSTLFCCYLTCQKSKNKWTKLNKLKQMNQKLPTHYLVKLLAFFLKTRSHNWWIKELHEALEPPV